MKFCFWLVYAVAGVVYGCVYTEDKGLSVQRSGWESGVHRWPLFPGLVGLRQCGMAVVS